MPKEIRPGEVRVGEIHLGEVRPAELRSPEVRLNVTIRFPPLIPGINTFPQPCEMVLVRHRLPLLR